MTPAQKLAITASEQRARLNTLAGVEAPTDEQRTELEALTTEYQDVELRWRAATLAEDAATETTATSTTTVDAATRERDELRARSTFGAYLSAAARGRAPSGAEAEYSASCDAGPGEIPLSLFEPERPPIEMRADATTPAPASGTGATLGAIQPFVFSASIAPRLGISMPTVGSGSYSEATVGTAATAAAKAKGSAAESTALALTPVTTTPRRISARLSIAAEDVAMVGNASFESALRENATLALSSEYDNQCINGAGADADVTGLIAQLTTPTAPTAVADFDAFLAAVAGQVDGLWAMSLQDVSTVVNPATYALSAAAFRDAGDNHRGDVAASSYLARETGGWWTASRMPAAPATGDGANIAAAVVHRRGRPGLTTAVHPTWATLTVDDIYTDSASAVRHYSIHVLVGAKVLLVQPAAYALARFKVA